MNANPVFDESKCVVCPTCRGSGQVWAQVQQGPTGVEAFWDGLVHPEHSTYYPGRTVDAHATCPTCGGEKYVPVED